jgi:hypothetical protein
MRLANITIEKVATPRDCKDFSFNLWNGSDSSNSPFVLDDDLGIGLCSIDQTDQPKNKTFKWVMPNVVYNATENVPALWELDNILCTSTLGTSQIDNTTVANGASIIPAPGDWVTCIFYDSKPAGPTRTQGFWKTHTNLTSHVFEDPRDLLPDMPEIGFTDGLMYIGNVSTGMFKEINSENDLFGAYFASIPKNDDRSKRTKVNKTRMVLLRQLVTAKLNCVAFGCSQGVILNITLADDAFSDGDLEEMRRLIGGLDEFNNSGDTEVSTLPYAQGNATPYDPKNETARYSKNLAKLDDGDGAPLGGIAYWDVLPGPP